MISNFLRVVLARSFQPIKFTQVGAKDIDTEVEEIGLYIHIPFCKTLCSFCPYNKVVYNKALAEKYYYALLKEIDLIGNYYKGKKVISLYFGGGTPALMIEYMEGILSKVREFFYIKESIAIELHPKDINSELMNKLRFIGFDMVSIGIQSFGEKELNTLGREYINGEEKVKFAKEAGFRVIDVDLIFGIKGQSEERLTRDFEKAFKSGATQVSTYPFIDFSYANNKHKPLKTKEKKKLLNVLENISSEMNLERTAVWTFGKKGVEKYSSITRDTYIGFGPSAATLTNSSFKINTFSVEEYINCLNKDQNPKMLTMNFSKRIRGLYWLFWNAYTLKLNNEIYTQLFNSDLEKDFYVELKISRMLGLISKNSKEYELTSRGTYLYHILEQHYTHQYIDKTWNVCRKEPWVKEIQLY
ncbi:radical SAM protein [Clostridium tarantellae]|uniref:Heme chaperone HemW n=1 Tax=Clostridium tarantellae TaxID=39493 RepID=A0A6I1MIH6_9CLOT|nr:radical SAM protein [Clostridium tarantellae]MPQ43175.1 radical SAM protein [Clostridium tarantellae]